jgi:hypothetical protein
MLDRENTDSAELQEWNVEFLHRITFLFGPQAGCWTQGHTKFLLERLEYERVVFVDGAAVSIGGPGCLTPGDRRCLMGVMLHCRTRRRISCLTQMQVLSMQFLTPFAGPKRIFAVFDGACPPAVKPVPQPLQFLTASAPQPSQPLSLDGRCVQLCNGLVGEGMCAPVLLPKHIDLERGSNWSQLARMFRRFPAAFKPKSQSKSALRKTESQVEPTSSAGRRSDRSQLFGFGDRKADRNQLFGKTKDANAC